MSKFNQMVGGRAIASGGFPPLLDERGAAEYLGVSPKTLQAWRLRGCGPIFRKIGRLVKYLEADLSVYVQRQARQSTSDTK